MTHWGDSLASDAVVLRLLTSDGKEQFISLVGRRELKIGSSHESDLILSGPAVAERHCRIFEKNGRLVLIDHGSRDGTQINDQRCHEPTPLREGDRIGIGFHQLQVMPGRAHLAPDAIADEMRYESPTWSTDLDAQFLDLLTKDAAAWRARGRPRRLLLRDERLARAAGAVTRDPSLSPWLAASAAAQRRRQGARWLLAGLVPGLLIAALVAAPVFRVVLAPAGAEPSPATNVEVDIPPTASLTCTDLVHSALPGETLAHVAARYDVDTRQLAADNDLGVGAPLTAGMTLKLCTHRPTAQPRRRVVTTRPGDTLESIARQHRVSVDQLRQHNPRLREPLAPNTAVDLWSDHLAPPEAVVLAGSEVPGVGISSGSPSAGTVANPVRITKNSDLFDLRCTYNAYASSHTLEQLNISIAKLRNAHNYHGMIVIADVSRKSGGGYGRHLSHQSGRDVDIWLPIEGGIYSQDAKTCNHCDSTWCRPEPEEVDWDAALDLIQSLAATDAVKNIFLDRELHEPLRAAARRAGLAPVDIDRLVQPRPGMPATVTHIKNHRHHLHVRFACGPDEPGCRN